MTRKLHVSDDLALPLDTVTSTMIVYGGKGMGKTVFGAVVAEEATEVGLRWAWLDPLGVGYGLRYSADGTGDGIECLILGGVHGDITITPEASAAVADIVVEETVNVLIAYDGKQRSLTSEGYAALGAYSPLPEGRALLEYWLSQLGESGASRILRVLAQAYPSAVSYDDVGAGANVSTKGGTFATYLSRLRGLELITGGRGGLKLSEELVG